jgi:hypothetical protein
MNIHPCHNNAYGLKIRLNTVNELGCALLYDHFVACRQRDDRMRRLFDRFDQHGIDRNVCAIESGNGDHARISLPFPHLADTFVISQKRMPNA